MRRFLILVAVMLSFAASGVQAESAFDGTYLGSFYETCRGQQSTGTGGFAVAGGILYYVSRQGGGPQAVQIQPGGTLSGQVSGGMLTGHAAPPHLDFVVQNGECSISYVLDKQF